MHFLKILHAFIWSVQYNNLKGNFDITKENHAIFLYVQELISRQAPESLINMIQEMFY